MQDARLINALETAVPRYITSLYHDKFVMATTKTHTTGIEMSSITFGILAMQTYKEWKNAWQIFWWNRHHSSWTTQFGPRTPVLTLECSLQTNSELLDMLQGATLFQRTLVEILTRLLMWGRNSPCSGNSVQWCILKIVKSGTYFLDVSICPYWLASHEEPQFEVLQFHLPIS